MQKRGTLKGLMNCKIHHKDTLDESSVQNMLPHVTNANTNHNKSPYNTRPPFVTQKHELLVTMPVYSEPLHQNLVGILCNYIHNINKETKLYQPVSRQCCPNYEFERLPWHIL